MDLKRPNLWWVALVSRSLGSQSLLGSPHPLFSGMSRQMQHLLLFYYRSIFFPDSKEPFQQCCKISSRAPSSNFEFQVRNDIPRVTTFPLSRFIFWLFHQGTWASHSLPYTFPSWLTFLCHLSCLLQEWVVLRLDWSSCWGPCEAVY